MDAGSTPRSLTNKPVVPIRIRVWAMARLNLFFSCGHHLRQHEARKVIGHNDTRTRSKRGEQTFARPELPLYVRVTSDRRMGELAHVGSHACSTNAWIRSLAQS